MNNNQITPGAKAKYYIGWALLILVALSMIGSILSFNIPGFIAAWIGSKIAFILMNEYSLAKYGVKGKHIFTKITEGL